MSTAKYRSILLINPHNTMPADSLRRIAIPLGLLYIGAALRQSGFTVSILDSTCEGYHRIREKDGYVTYGLAENEIADYVRSTRPDFIGIQSMFSAHQENALDICRVVKSVHREIPVALGGVHPSLAPGDCLSNDNVDFVILGEGEFRLPKLLSALNRGKAEFDFDGIAWKQGNRVWINPMKNRIANLDSIPLPAWDLVDMEKYIDINVPYAPFPRRDRVGYVLTSRGCPYRCIFCSTVNFWGRKFRKRSVENIMQEIDILVNKYGIEEIQFMDDNMTIDRRRAMNLFARLKDYNLKWCTPHGIMAKTLDEEMIKLMAESGAYQLAIGIESGSRRVLKDIIHKAVPTKNEIGNLIETCHKFDIQMHGLFSLGYPGETMAEIRETLQYPFDVGFDSVSFFIANPMPGSDLHQLCREKGYIAKEDCKMDVKSADIIIPEDSPDYVISRQDLVDLVDCKTRQFNQFSRTSNPQAWERKFKCFMKNHQGQADLVQGRVT